MTTQKTNPLEALLSANPDVRENVFIKRLSADFVIKALDQDELTAAQEEASYGGEMKETELNNIIIAKSCVEPDFSNEDLIRHYNAIDSGDCVKKALKVGEIAVLSQKILEVSGFDTTLDQAKK